MRREGIRHQEHDVESFSGAWVPGSALSFPILLSWINLKCQERRLHRMYSLAFPEKSV